MTCDFYNEDYDHLGVPGEREDDGECGKDAGGNQRVLPALLGKDEESLE